MLESLALKLVEDYLKNHKYTPLRIYTARLPSGKKAPDFEVKDDEKLKFYCEVKTPDLRLNEKTHTFHWTTTVSKLRDLIHKAVKQFKDQDPRHLKPWVIVFTSSHFQLNWSNLTHCIQGAVGYDTQLVKDLRNQNFINRTNKDIKTIDLFIWCQVNAEKKKVYQMVHFANADSKLLKEITEISDKLIPYANEDIMDRNSKKYP